jgi:serine phosphatase RsbU (regulator of sigma subunit)
MGDYKNAYHHLEMQQKYDRANFNDSTLSALSDVKAQQISMKERLEREKNEAIHDADKRRMHTQIIALVGGLVLVVLVIFYMLRAYEIKRKANKELWDKNNILNTQKAEIATQKDIITEQWHEVEAVNHKLFSSIHYARRIQRAAVSSEEEVHKVFPDSFVFYRPRDIVSGDFYRCGRCGRYSVMITADCTGHGIPGAFLSMLGISALKEYMATEYDAENPGTVLDRIRDFIKTTLSAADDGSHVSDGMDMTICCYDYEKMELRYAAANQKFYIIRGGEVIKKKGNSMPVGRFVRETQHFVSYTHPLQKGDMIYTFSDGIQDQLGYDPNGDKRKFTSLQLLETLLSIADKPLETQSQILEQKILDWRGNIPQVDDITLVGVRV